jgi:hypothetical protein
LDAVELELHNFLGSLKVHLDAGDTTLNSVGLEMENGICGINVGLEIRITSFETLVDILFEVSDLGLAYILMSGLVPFVRRRGFLP